MCGQSSWRWRQWQEERTDQMLITLVPSTQNTLEGSVFCILLIALPSTQNTLQDSVFCVSLMAPLKIHQNTEECSTDCVFLYSGIIIQKNTEELLVYTGCNTYRVQHREWNRKGGIQNDGYHRGPYNGLDDAGNCDRGGRAHAFYNESDLTNCNVEKREK